MSTYWDLTNKKGMLHAYNQMYSIPKMAYELIKDFLSTDTTKQAKTVEDIIRAGRGNHVDMMEIKLKKFWGGKINVPEDINIDMKLGKDEETIIKVKYK